jgi:hypothetical protein
MWPRSGAGDKLTRVQYCCNSWRCEVCRRHEAAVLFARLREAAVRPELDPRGWCFLVLTLDRNGDGWTDVNAAYRALSKLTNRTLKRIGRRWGTVTRVECSGRKKKERLVRALGNQWIAVVEAHRSGWPHMNLFVWCPELAELLEQQQRETLEDPHINDAHERSIALWKARRRLPAGAVGPRFHGEIPAELRAGARKATVARGDVLALLTGCGWGYQSTAERARDVEAVLSYGTKLAGMHDDSLGELAKVTQAPLCAPARFRRFRCGKGFLAPRRSNPEVTGCLVRRRRAVAGDWEIASINAPKDPAQLEQVERARLVELALIEEEERIMSRARGKLAAMPPVRFARGGALEPHKVTSERRAALQSRELAACG